MRATVLSPRARSLPGLIALLGVLATASTAAAYPSSVIYAPDARVLALGTISPQIYGSLVLHPSPVRVGDVWGGIEAGIAPRVVYGRTSLGELAFGGAEIGFDFFHPDVTNGLGFALNAKVQALAETVYLPEIGVGLFQFTPDLSHGAHLAYLSIGKEIRVGRWSFGRVLAGLAYSFAQGAGATPDCIAAGTACVFRGSEPFLDGRGALILGYETPRFGPFSVAVDHLGGTSSVSGTNIGVNVYSETGLYAGVGVWLANDRRPSPPGPGVADGVFAFLGANVDLRSPLHPDRAVLQHSGRRPPPPPAERPSAPSSPPPPPPTETVLPLHHVTPDENASETVLPPEALAPLPDAGAPR